MYMKRFLLALACLGALTASAVAAPRHVIVIAMENKDSDKAGNKSRDYIYRNTEAAPYLNGELAAEGARATNFADDLAAYDSEPHYIMMEAGTNKFADTTFTCDNDPLKSCSLLFGKPNWTRSTEHLVTALETANPPLSWMTYQEGIDPQTTGACPIRSAGQYAAKHNPFVYFADVAGAPPDKNNAKCIAHTRPLDRFMADMQSGKLANYVFITPNLCHDMHGGSGCDGNVVKAGDDFLKSFVPPVIDWAKQNDAVVFIVWDEGKRGLTLPFYAAGAGVKANFESRVPYTHRSVVKTIQRIFGLPVLASVTKANDLADMFEPGALP
jgi:hypothetical protein